MDKSDFPLTQNGEAEVLHRLREVAASKWYTKIMLAIAFVVFMALSHIWGGNGTWFRCQGALELADARHFRNAYDHFLASRRTFDFIDDSA